MYAVDLIVSIEFLLFELVVLMKMLYFEGENGKLVTVLYGCVLGGRYGWSCTVKNHFCVTQWLTG